MRENWADDTPFMSETGASQRVSPGLPKATRVGHYTTVEQFMYHNVELDHLKELREAPPEVKAAFEEIFRHFIERDGEKCLELRFSPILKRWCIYQPSYHKPSGRRKWRVAYVCCEEPGDDFYVPTDYRDDIQLSHLAGVIGEYKLPDKADFQMFDDMANIEKHGATELTNRWTKYEYAPIEEARKHAEAVDDDFIDYYGNEFVDSCNQEAGSGQKMRSVADKSKTVKTNPMFYKITQKNGYKLREKIDKEGLRRWIQEVYEMVTGEKWQPGALLADNGTQTIEQMLEGFEIVDEQKQPLTRAQFELAMVASKG